MAGRARSGQKTDVLTPSPKAQRQMHALVDVYPDGKAAPRQAISAPSSASARPAMFAQAGSPDHSGAV
jgi:hypothetical protein